MYKKISRDNLLQEDGFAFCDVLAALFNDFFGKTIEEMQAEGFPEPMIRSILLTAFANEVGGGGIHQFLCWFRPREVEYVIESLRIIGENRLASLVEFGVPLAVRSDYMFDEGRDYEPFQSYSEEPGYHNLEEDFQEAYTLIEDDKFYVSLAAYMRNNLDCFAE